MKPLPKDRLSLNQLPLRTSEQAKASLRRSETAAAAFPKPEDDGYSRSARFFDAAMRDPRCGLTNQEVAYLLHVSESLVQKWRSPDAHACPSFAQLLRLPVSFHVALNRAMNPEFAFGLAALRDVLEGLGRLVTVGHE